MDIPMSLPLDSDGFLRRECPNCERQFKWFSNPTNEETSDEELLLLTPEAYFCPYCYELASTDAWWTKQQLEYAKQIALSQALGPEIRKLQRNLKGMSSKMLKVEVNEVSFSDPVPLEERDDMVLVKLPCHLNEPLKVDPEWSNEVACLVCGIQYPIDLVRITD